MKISVSFFISILILVSSYGEQNLYESIEIKDAITNGTRTRFGIPGEKYWQNHINYHIVADIEPASGLITGVVQMEFINLSPDTLKRVVIKLKQNLYQEGAKRTTRIQSSNLHHGIEIKEIRQDNKEIRIADHFPKSTVWFVNLNNFILPEAKTTLYARFVTKLPDPTEIRTGAYNETSYFAGYWFPQLAVYDDVFGWDTEEYMGHTETYNNFANYNVKLNMPNSFLVWATGELQNAADIFREEYLNKIEKSKISEQVVHVILDEDLKRKKIFVREKNITWHYKADTVTDFAFAFSDHYAWDAVAARNPDSTNLCWVNVAYPSDNINYIGVVDMAKATVEFFANELPGVPYPYSTHTSFNGRKGGGMEFPMMANNMSSGSKRMLQLVTSHEIAHNYFPFMIGINERKFGWFDEMMTSIMDRGYIADVFSEAGPDSRYDEIFSYEKLAGSYSDLPIMTESSTVIKPQTMVLNFYVKSILAMKALQSIIGEGSFNIILREFMLAWKGKHPLPHDLFYFFNERAEQNFNWFWEKWFFSFAMVDLKLKNVSDTSDAKVIEIENTGGLPVAFTLKYKLSDGETEVTHFDASVWKETKTCYLSVKSDKNIESAEILLSDLPDLVPEDNKWPVE